MYLLVLARLLPVALFVAAAVSYFVYVEGPRGYPLRNAVPALLGLALASVVLIRGRGSWTEGGWRWLLGAIGFAVPAIGLSVYLHYGFAHDANGMYSNAVYPYELFRYLPYYTTGAGCIGFAIGWIVGRNI